MGHRPTTSFCQVICVRALPRFAYLKIWLAFDITSLQTGPYLRNEEGQEAAVLCNHDDLIEGSREAANNPDFEVVSPPNTPCKRWANIRRASSYLPDPRL